MSPRGLPDLRTVIAAEVAGMADQHTEVTRTAAGALTARECELFWVTSDMAHLAQAASETLPEWTAAAVIPSHDGVLIWDSHDLPKLTAMLHGQVRPEVAVCGATWHVQDGQLWVVALFQVSEIRKALTALANLGGPNLGVVPVASPVLPGATVYPIDMTEIQDAGAIGGPGGPIMALLVSTWLMMSQPTVATAQKLTPKGQAYHRAKARDLPIPSVRLVDLRTVRHPSEPSDDEQEARSYTRRWLVRGHWRQQACGPRRSQRKPVWIAPYVKGPEGTPLVVGEHVNVWRR